VSLLLRHGLGGYAPALGGLVMAAVTRTRAEVALLAFVAAYMLVVDSSYEVFWRSVLPALPALALLGRERRLLATADTCLPCYVWPLDVPVTRR